MTSNAYILTVLELVRKNVRFFLGASLAALALRLFFVMYFPAVVDDSRLYADIATNWLRHGIYGVTNSGQIVPTLSRLPGYPAFLAAIFAIFGPNNFRAVLLMQILFDLATCFVIADLACRMLSERAAKAAFLLAALCPFLANYAAAALTETLEIFFTTLALNFAVRGLATLCDNSPAKQSAIWFCCGLSISACILLRPDGGILFGAIAAYLFTVSLRSLLGRRADGSALRSLPLLRAGLILTLSTFIPLVPWTLRNLHTMHRLQPLAPRYANDSDELVMAGFNRWTKTWMLDYTSVQEIYWKVQGEAMDVGRLPQRAFDSPQQRQETQQLFIDYNQDHDLTPELDARFAALAAARMRSAPLRYYLWLPALRIADMWLRPRAELLPADPRWWEFDDEVAWLAVSLVFALINASYIVMAATGFLRSREIFGIGLFVIFVALRSLFLGTLENPEPRYTLECFPVVIVMAAALFISKSNANDRKAA